MCIVSKLIIGACLGSGERVKEIFRFGRAQAFEKGREENRLRSVKYSKTSLEKIEKLNVIVRVLIVDFNIGICRLLILYLLYESGDCRYRKRGKRDREREFNRLSR